MTEIRWEDPPRSRRGAHKPWLERVEPLVEQPKRWAIVYVSPTKGSAAKMVYSLNHHGMQLPPGRFEFTSRTVNGEHRVYGRYLGPDEDGAP